MSQPNATPTLTCSPAPTGVGLLRCPRCGENGATIDLHLNDASFGCQDCDEAFEIDEVRDMIAAVKKWERVLKWVALMPTEDE
jgi:transposase-like protein